MQSRSMHDEMTGTATLLPGRYTVARTASVAGCRVWIADFGLPNRVVSGDAKLDRCTANSRRSDPTCALITGRRRIGYRADLAGESRVGEFAGRISPGRISPGEFRGRISPGEPRRANSRAYLAGRTSTGRSSPGRSSPGRTSPGRTSPGRTSPGRSSPGDPHRAILDGAHRPITRLSLEARRVRVLGADVTHCGAYNPLARRWLGWSIHWLSHMGRPTTRRSSSGSMGAHILRCSMTPTWIAVLRDARCVTAALSRTR